MPLFRDEGVVLRRLDYSETSQVVCLFTRDRGQVRIIAKGTKRSTRTRFATGIDLLDVGHVVFSAHHSGQQELATLTEWKQSTSNWGLRQRLDRLYAAQYAAEITAGLTAEWDPHPVLYDVLRRLLASLCDGEDVMTMLITFIGALLDETGFAPQMNACVGCGRSIDPAGPVFFSSLDGGLVCRDCEGARVEKRQTDRAAVHILRGATASNAAGRRAVFDLLDYHLSHLMGRPPRLAGPLRAALDPQRRA